MTANLASRLQNNSVALPRNCGAGSRRTLLEWVKAWVNDPAAHGDFLTSFLSLLRDAFFARHANGKKRDVGLADRSQQAATIILEACSSVADASHAALTAETVKGAQRDAAVAVTRPRNW